MFLNNTIMHKLVGYGKEKKYRRWFDVILKMHFQGSSNNVSQVLDK